MSLFSQTKQLCHELGIRPSRRRGQNFLIEENTLGKIIRLAELSPSDLVLEVGTGFGFFTKTLARVAQKIITVESDKKIIGYLEKEFENSTNIKLIKGDISSKEIQDQIFKEFAGKNYKVVANIPYQITSFLIKLFLTADNSPEELILLLQKEVAQRIIAKPPKMNLLALSVNFYAEPKILSYISHNNFWPRPKVDSALIKLKLSKKVIARIRQSAETKQSLGIAAPRRNVGERNDKITSSLTVSSRGGNKEFCLNKKEKGKNKTNEEKLFKIIKIGFANKRKKLISNLAKELKIEKQGLKAVFSSLGWKENLRAEELGLEEWLRLTQILDVIRQQSK